MKINFHKSLSQRLLPIFLSASSLLFAVFPADAIIDAALQMQLGNPSGATADPNNHNHYLIQRTVEAIDYNDNMGQPNWVSWDLTAADVGNSGRTDAWASDTSLPPGFNIIPTSTYGSIGGQSYDRGHMCPSADRTDTVPHNELVFIMSNIIPQASAQNQGVWATFESYCRSLLPSQELLITCGPYNFGPNTVDGGLVAIASNTFKIVVGVPLGAGTALNRITNANPNSIRVIALAIPNTGAVGGSAWTTFVTSTKQVQADTGYTFFNALPNNLAWVLRSKVDGQASPVPGAITFSPANGASGTTVTITGTSLDTVTNVTFNGAVASYTITSPTQIAATVPAATSGSITVQGLGGNATSSSSFIVAGATAADLAITTTHTGNFTQGDTGDLYTIIVTNAGGSASSGTVTVVDTLPTGLSPIAISGAGWAANLGTLTCTRSDALAAGAVYPPIFVSVSVSASAPFSVTNIAAVSGGGDTNLSNNTASVVTTVNAAQAPAVITGIPSGIGATIATLNGTVNPNGQPATGRFEYGVTTNYGSIVSVAGTFTGTAAQTASANLTGLTASTLYHFRLAATNVLGSVTGLDQAFITAAAPVPDLAITVTHTGDFTQGDIGAVYTIMITNVGAAASSGVVTVTNLLPAGLIATALSGSGWETNFGSLTCTRSDSLAAGASYPPITVTVNVATNAPATVTNIAAVSGGGEANLANNTASDPTTIHPSSGGGGTTTLAGWDVSGLPGGSGNFGPSPLAPTTNAANLTIIAGLTRGAGIGTNGTGAARGWGGNTFTETTSTAAIASNRFVTFTAAVNSGYRVSYASISKFNYRHSATGPPNGFLQYQVGAGSFADITVLSYPSNTSSGGSLSPINLSGIPALQDVGAGTNVTFRIVNWGGTSSAGTWYIFDVTNSTALDFEVRGTVFPAVVPAPDLAIAMTHVGDFTQGDTNATYTISVTNMGTAATLGQVSVVDVLPAGLIVTAMGGNGWVGDLGTLTCTRSDPLAAGDSYPPITVTVTVAANAAATVTNSALVAGGGDTSPANNTVSDPTTILPAAAPTAITETASGVGTSTATLNGAVNPNGQSAAVHFQYGLTTDYGSNATIVGGLLGTTVQPVSASLPGLLPGTTYHFRVAATNVLGANVGEDQVFTTLAPIEAWRFQWFGMTANSGAAADTTITTADGMPNLLKYALGLNPLVAANDPVTGDISTGYLRLTAPKNPQATDVSFVVEVTDNLTAPWTTNGTTVDIDTATLLEVHANAPVDSSAAGFMRLRVSRP